MAFSFEPDIDLSVIIVNYNVKDLLKNCLESIFNFQKDKLIKRIEEDQNLYLSMLEVNEIIELNNYKKTPITFTGKNIIIGIIDDGINQEYD